MRCVGGGSRSVDDVALRLDAGVDKISVNTTPIRDPNLSDCIADAYGSRCIVLAIDTRAIDSTKAGYALDITRTVSEADAISVIASGGAGRYA